MVELIYSRAQLPLRPATMASSRHCCSFDGKLSALSTQHLMGAYTQGKIDLSGYKPYSAVESHHTAVVSLESLYILA